MTQNVSGGGHQALFEPDLEGFTPYCLPMAPASRLPILMGTEQSIPGYQATHRNSSSPYDQVSVFDLGTVEHTCTPWTVVYVVLYPQSPTQPARQITRTTSHNTAP